LGTASYSTDIRDITSGNNATRNSGGLYDAGVGYDMASGIGSPLAQTLTQTLVGGSTPVGVQMPVAEQLTIPGQNAAFTVAVGGSSATYQWQQMPAGGTTWSNLSDNGAYSGSATASLTVTNATTAMSGNQFQCVISLSGGVVTTSTPSVLVVDSPLVISTLAGTAGTTGRGNGNGAGATFAYPSGVACDSSGNIYVADFNNNEIREVSPVGAVTTPYGSLVGTSGSTNAGGNSALFNTPNGVAIDGSNNIYVADTGNNLVRKIVSGSVSTLAGSGGQFSEPEGVAVDSLGNVYVADTGNDTIDKITSSGSVSVLAGQKGTAGYANGAAATQALFSAPSAVTVDGSGNVYVADFGNSVIREINTGTGMVSTLAGQPGVSGYLDGPGAAALFNAPTGIAIDSSDNLYITDCLVPPIGSNAAGNDLVRKLTPAGVVSTIAGQAGNEGAASGTGTAAEFYSDQALTLYMGTVYLADTYNQTIRMGTPQAPPTISVAATQAQAMVFGPTPGQFTVTRTGGTSGTLTVSYSLAGTAVSGTDYTPLPGTVTIPSGSISAVISVNPIADSGAASSPTLQLTLTPAESYTVGSPSTATVTIQEITPFQTWEMNEFGANAMVPSIGGEYADPANNGVANLLSYAFNLDPLQTGTESLPVTSLAQDSNGLQYLALTYTQITTDPNLTYTVQVTGDLTQETDTWHSGASYTTVVSQVPNGNTTQVTVRDNIPISQASKRFIRVEVSGN
jgi:sugar lactone lactonase YvrE